MWSFSVFSGQRGDVRQGEVRRPVLDDDHEEELQGGTKGGAAIRKGLFQALLFVQPAVGGPLPAGDDTRGGKSQDVGERILLEGIFMPPSIKYEYFDIVQQEKGVIFCYIMGKKILPKHLPGK